MTPEIAAESAAAAAAAAAGLRMHSLDTKKSSDSSRFREGSMIPGRERERERELVRPTSTLSFALSFSHCGDLSIYPKVKKHNSASC